MRIKKKKPNINVNLNFCLQNSLGFSKWNVFTGKNYFPTDSDCTCLNASTCFSLWRGRPLVGAGPGSSRLSVELQQAPALKKVAVQTQSSKMCSEDGQTSRLPYPGLSLCRIESLAGPGAPWPEATKSRKSEDFINEPLDRYSNWSCRQGA